MTESGREQFEKWALAQGDSIARHCKNHSGKPCHKYLSTFTHWEWMAWQAAFEAGRGGWISVDVRLPAERERVLIVHAAAPDNMHYPKVDVEMAFMADGEWYDAGDTRNMGAFNNETWSIEFWQPLPAPPDSGDKRGTGDGR